MFVAPGLAARIDAVEARLSRAVAQAVTDGHPPSWSIPVGGGAAVFARPASPMNKVIGAGFAGAIATEDLDALEARYAAVGEPPRFELATLASTEAAEQLARRGYLLRGFEDVLVRSLASVPARSTRIEVRTGDLDTWTRVVVEGFAAGDGTGQEVDHHSRDALDQIMRDFARAPGFSHHVAYLDGVPAGAASLRLDDGIALLAGATTLPAMRRRGVQGALLAARLTDAHEAGCELAVVTTAPGSQSQANVMRGGFALGYTRAVLVRDHAG